MEGKKLEKMPIGIIIILILLSIGMIKTLFSLRAPMAQIGPVLFTGMPATTITILFAAIIGIMVYGIVKKFRWAWKLIIGWYLICMIIVLSNYVFFTMNETMYDKYNSEVLPPETVSLMTSDITKYMLFMKLITGWIGSSIIILYLYKKKDYFVN